MEQNKTKKYERLLLEVVSFESKDVLSTSNGGGNSELPGISLNEGKFVVDPF